MNANRTTSATLPSLVTDALDEATGAHLREDPILEQHGGPAGNAILTAWTGMVLLTLSVGELLTLFDVRGLITWHVALGALLVPPALLKTATTGWRMVRYYTRNPSYEQAGPPPMLLRLLGPIVVVSTLGLLATGILLILIGEQRSHQTIVDVLGFQIGWITLHQGAFIVWGAATGLHLLGRIVPAIRILFSASSRAVVPGRALRFASLALMILTAAGLAVLLVHRDTSWQGQFFFGGDRGH